MRPKTLTAFLVTLLLCAGYFLPGYSQDLKPTKLPEPKIDQSKSLVLALKDRKSTREFGSGTLSQQQLSNLLWAAWGINRPDSGKRTAPSALNSQEIDVYVSTAEGAYRYDAKANVLVPVAAGDIRDLTGTQPYVKDAAVNLVYVADFSKMGGREEGSKIVTSAANTGFIAQNVYLYCAAEGLAAVFRAGIDKDKLSQAMKLRPEQKITFAQSVGLPKLEK